MAVVGEQQEWVEAASVDRDLNGWVSVRTAGSPYVRGFQHGYLLASELDACLRSNRYWATWMTAQDFSFFSDMAMEHYAPKLGEEYTAEIRGIADGARAGGCDTTFAEVLGWNSFVDLVYSGWPSLKKGIRPFQSHPRPHRDVGHRCSAFIATGDATLDGAIVMAHNTWDAYLQAQHFNVVLDITPDDGHRMVMQTAPGWIASMMDFTITGAGLMITETTIDGFSGFDIEGAPAFLRSRRACQYGDSIDSWAEILTDGHNGGYANSWLIGDRSTNEIARYELGLTYQSDIVKMTSGVLHGQNVANDLRIRNLETTDPSAWSDIAGSGARRVRWRSMLEDAHGAIDLGVAEHMIGDHYDGYLDATNPSSRTICGHIDHDDGKVGSAHGHPPFYPWGAVDAKVADSTSAAGMGFRGRWGRGCGQPFDAAEFLDQHRQYDWLDGYLIDRPTQPWTALGGSGPDSLHHHEGRTQHV